MMSPYSHLQPIAELPGDLGFTVWGLGTRDDLEAVLDSNYFSGKANLLYDGDIIIVNRRPWSSRPEEGAEKMILAVGKDHRGTLSLRRLFTLPPAGLATTPKATR